MPNKNIYIFSRPIRTGKTTALLDWLQKKEHVGGILTPDIDGKRKLYDISSKKIYDFQLDDDTEEEKVIVGKFIFSSAVFEKARDILSDIKEKNWFVIDEIGKLETEQDRGFEPALSEAIKKFKQQNGNGKLLLVIRDTLLEQAIKKYELQAATVVHSPETLC